jgi:hypothetical protein
MSITYFRSFTSSFDEFSLLQKAISPGLTLPPAILSSYSFVFTHALQLSIWLRISAARAS